jgi:hypothetical protein
MKMKNNTQTQHQSLNTAQLFGLMFLTIFVLLLVGLVAGSALGLLQTLTKTTAIYLSLLSAVCTSAAYGFLGDSFTILAKINFKLMNLLTFMTSSKDKEVSEDDSISKVIVKASGSTLIFLTVFAVMFFILTNSMGEKYPKLTYIKSTASEWVKNCENITTSNYNHQTTMIHKKKLLNTIKAKSNKTNYNQPEDNLFEKISIIYGYSCLLTSNAKNGYKLATSKEVIAWENEIVSVSEFLLNMISKLEEYKNITGRSDIIRTMDYLNKENYIDHTNVYLAIALASTLRIDDSVEMATKLQTAKKIVLDSVLFNEGIFSSNPVFKQLSLKENVYINQRG